MQHSRRNFLTKSVAAAPLIMVPGIVRAQTTTTQATITLADQDLLAQIDEDVRRLNTEFRDPAQRGVHTVARLESTIRYTARIARRFDADIKRELARQISQVGRGQLALNLSSPSHRLHMLEEVRKIYPFYTGSLVLPAPVWTNADRTAVLDFLETRSIADRMLANANRLREFVRNYEKTRGMQNVQWTWEHACSIWSTSNDWDSEVSTVYCGISYWFAALRLLCAIWQIESAFVRMAFLYMC